MYFDVDSILEIIFLISILIAIACLPIACKMQIDRNKWLKTHCKIIGKMSDDVGFGISTSGSPVTTFIGGKTGYKCDDNMTYWE